MAKHPRQKFHVNRKLFAISAAIIVVATPSLLVWYRYQVHRLAAGVLLEHGERAFDEGNFDRAYTYYHNHLLLRPDDYDARIRSAEVLAKLDPTPQGKLQVAKEYAVVLAQEPNREELRLKIAEALVPVDPDAALESADAVLKSNPASQEAKWIRSRALYGKYLAGELGSDSGLLALIRSLEVALKNDKGETLDAVRLAELYREHAEVVAADRGLSAAEIEAQGDAIVRKLGTTSQTKASAAAARMQYFMKYASAEYGEEQVRLDMQQILDDDSVDIEILLLAGENRYEQEELETAKTCFERAMLRNPTDDRPYLGCAKIAERLGQPDEVRRLLQEGLEARKGRDSFSLLVALGQWQLQQGEWEPAGLTLEQLRRSGFRAGKSGKANRGKAARIQGDWYAADENPARNHLKAVEQYKIALENEPIDPARIRFNLGNCYLKLGHFDLAAAAFQSTWSQRLDWQAKVLEAEALRLSGQLDDSASSFKLALAQSIPDAFLPMIQFSHARAELARQGLRSRETRDWTEFDRALRQLKKPSTMALASLLEVEAGIIREDLTEDDAIKKQLLALEDEHQGDVKFLSELLDLYLRMRLESESERVIGKLDAFGQSSTAGARARLAMIRGNLFDVETVGSGSASDDTQLSELKRLVENSLRTGDYPSAKSSLQRLSQSLPQSIYTRFALGQLASDKGDVETLRSAISELREIEGEQGSLYRTLRVYEGILAGDDVSLANAALLARRLADTRPNWSVAHSSLGLVRHRQGRFAEAANHLEMGLARGDRRPKTLAAALQSQVMTGNQYDSMRVLRARSNEDCADLEVANLAVSVLLEEGEYTRAEQIARIALGTSPNEAKAHLLLAQVLIAGDDNAESVALIDRALHMAPNDPVVWLASIALGLQIRDTQMMASSLRRMQLMLDAYPSQAREQLYLFASAISLQMENRLPLATTFMLKASKMSGPFSASSFVLPLHGVAEFTLTNPTVDTRCLNDLLRYYLESGDAEKLPEPPRMDYVVDVAMRRRCEAILSLTYPSEANRQQARATLSQIPDMSRGDHLLLAEFARIEGNEKEALERYRSACDASPPVTVLQDYARFALQVDSLDHAREALDQLSIESDLALHMAYHLKTDDHAAAISLAKGLIEAADELEDPQRLSQKIGYARVTGKVFAEGGLELDPEALIPPRDSDRDAAQIRQWCGIEFQSRMGILPKNVVLPLSALVQLAYTVDGHSPEADQIGRMLRDSIVSSRQYEAELLVALSAIRERQGRTAEAMTIVNEALERFPDSDSHRNNRVWLGSLYESASCEESLRQINEVIRDAGPLDYMLDTKAMILATNDQFEKAATILYAIASPVEASPTIRMHYAHVCAKLGEDQTSRNVFNEISPRLEQLVPFDLQLRQGLEQTLGLNAPESPKRFSSFVP